MSDLDERARLLPRSLDRDGVFRVGEELPPATLARLRRAVRLEAATTWLVVAAAVVASSWPASRALLVGVSACVLFKRGAEVAREDGSRFGVVLCRVLDEVAWLVTAVLVVAAAEAPAPAAGLLVAASVLEYWAKLVARRAGAKPIW